MKENPDKNDEYLDWFVSLQLEVLSKSAPDLIKLKDKINRNIGRVQLDATTRYDLHIRLESMPKHTRRLCSVQHNNHPRRHAVYNRLGARFTRQCNGRRRNNVSCPQIERRHGNSKKIHRKILRKVRQTAKICSKMDPDNRGFSICKMQRTRQRTSSFLVKRR